MNFGDRLKELRSKNGMTQTRLAQLLNITNLMGIDKKKTIDVSDLSDEDISVLNHMADTLRKKNKDKKA